MDNIKYSTLLGFAVCATLFATASHAQSVTLYGIVDTGIEYVNHANSSGRSVIRMPGTTGELPSRWGLKGNEPLGAGYSAIFTLESGFALPTGVSNQGGRLFGRQAYVGIDAPWGTLTLGRQYSMSFWGNIPADLIGTDIYGIGTLDAWLANLRSDNTVAYRGKFGAFNFGGTYSFGRDASPGTASNTPGQASCAGSIPGDASACREWSVMAKYDKGTWNVGATYDRQYGGPASSVAVFNGLPAVPLVKSSDYDGRLIFDGYARLGNLSLGALWIARRVVAAQRVSSDQVALEAAYQLSPALFVDGLVQRIVNTQQDTRATTEMIRMTYLLSVRTAIYAQTAFLQNSKNAAYSVSGGGLSTPAKGMNQVGAMIGLRHSF
ncbi:putative porin [Paraburkholderia sp. BL23I1N1]|uniref:porin n=1 Tax=Paraburkholderia sp. BL23I1N1 TaxID=1938802 RepID=UPI000E76892F|nr:porin [Paraburkholderia sp. BL23I1N1]RKE38595.1 putative porin [Paraburkholderia sp. BL23I1N1]